MRTREATYADYGFEEGEDRQLSSIVLIWTAGQATCVAVCT